jgi:hypothetical protein
VRFQILTAASVKFRIVFWDALPCKIIVDRRFRGTCCLHHQGDETCCYESVYKLVKEQVLTVFWSVHLVLSSSEFTQDLFRFEDHCDQYWGWGWEGCGSGLYLWNVGPTIILHGSTSQKTILNVFLNTVYYDVWLLNARHKLPQDV